jgi:predicted regulator of Ras-like GTPase activity (Roadblock/LC7/MglB family)
MPTLPQLLEEDIRVMEAALDDFLSKSEATSALILDKGGFLISERGDVNSFDSTTLGALAAAAYAATQGIAGLVQETSFSSVYQQGETFSILVNDIDEHCLLVAIFRAQISVGAVKYYAATTIGQIAQQLLAAHSRAPGEGLDLSVLNVADTSDIFQKRTEEEVEEDGDPNDPVVKLQRMKKLLAGGLITEEDFDQMKRRILEQM